MRLGRLRDSADRPVRFRRHLVLIAAAHLRSSGVPATASTRELLSEVTRRAWRELTGATNARGVNAKLIQREPVCDRIYRWVRGLPRRATWPRHPDGRPFERVELARAIAEADWLAAEMDRRTVECLDLHSEALSRLYDEMVRPAPLERRVDQLAPPIIAPASIRIPRDLRDIDLHTLAIRHAEAGAVLARARAGYRQAIVRRALALVNLHRARLGID